MDHTFSLMKDKDIYRIFIEAPVLKTNLFLAGGKPDIGWSTDIEDARVFQYGKEAIAFVLSNTKMRQYKHPISGGFIIVDFDANQITINLHAAPSMTMDMNLYKALVTLPIHSIKELQ